MTKAPGLNDQLSLTMPPTLGAAELLGLGGPSSFSPPTELTSKPQLGSRRRRHTRGHQLCPWSICRPRPPLTVRGQSQGLFGSPAVEHVPQAHCLVPRGTSQDGLHRVKAKTADGPLMARQNLQRQRSRDRCGKGWSTTSGCEECGEHQRPG